MPASVFREKHNIYKFECISFIPNVGRELAINVFVKISRTISALRGFRKSIQSEKKLQNHSTARLGITQFKIWQYEEESSSQFSLKSLVSDIEGYFSH